MVAVRKDYAAPTGLKFYFGFGSTNMPRRRRWGWDERRRQLQFGLDVWGFWRLNLCVKIIIALVAIIGTLGLTGCKPKTTTLTGQVFIVTQGAENVKLGDVEILLIEKSQVTDFLEKEQSIVESEIASRQKALNIAEEDAQKAQLEFNSFLKYGRPATNSDSVEIQQQSDAVRRKIDGLSKQFDIVYAQQSANDANPQGWNPAWIAISDSLINQEDALLEKNKSYVDELKLLSLKFDALVARHNAEETNKLDVAKLRVVSAKQKLENSPTPEDYLSDFSPVVFKKTLSDADGKYSFIYPPNKSLAIYASARRSILNGTEKYYWLDRKSVV